MLFVKSRRIIIQWGAILVFSTKVENHCIMASLPLLVGDTNTKKNGSPGDLFWRIISNESEDDIGKLTEQTKMPRLISTGDIVNIETLALAAEGMVVCQFRTKGILNAVISLLASFYTFNISYPIGQAKNIFILLECLLLGKSIQNLSVGVENFICSLNL